MISSLWGGSPKAKAKRGRPASPPPPPVVRVCEFCRNTFAHTGRADRPRRTCTLVCAAGLRKRKKQHRALERFRAARAAKWLSFPKEEVVDG